jgi:hypothetical protein
LRRDQRSGRGERHECAVIPACFWRESSVFCFSHESAMYEFTTLLKKARTKFPPLQEPAPGEILGGEGGWGCLNDALPSPACGRGVGGEGGSNWRGVRIHDPIEKGMVHRHSRALPRPKSLRGQVWRESSVFCFSHEDVVCEFMAPLKRHRQIIFTRRRGERHECAVIPACIWRESSVFCFSHEGVVCELRQIKSCKGLGRRDKPPSAFGERGLRMRGCAEKGTKCRHSRVFLAGIQRLLFFTRRRGV